MAEAGRHPGPVGGELRKKESVAPGLGLGFDAAAIKRYQVG